VWIGWINTVGGDRPMLGARKYDSLREKHGPADAPRARTLMRWAEMPWSQMCAAAGKSGGDPGPPPWPEAAKVKALRAAAAAIGRAELLTLEVYMQWRAAQPDPGAYPSGNAFGSGEWLEWCERARVNGATKKRRVHYSDEQLLDCLLAAGDGSGRVGTTSYERYHREHAGAPARTTIIARFGGWRQAQDAAAAAAARRKRRARKEELEQARAASEAAAPGSSSRHRQVAGPADVA